MTITETANIQQSNLVWNIGHSEWRSHTIHRIVGVHPWCLDFRQLLLLTIHFVPFWTLYGSWLSQGCFPTARKICQNYAELHAKYSDDWAISMITELWDLLQSSEKVDKLLLNNNYLSEYTSLKANKESSMLRWNRFNQIHPFIWWFAWKCQAK